MSLVDQCLRLHASNAHGKVSIPGQGTKRSHAMQYSRKKTKTNTTRMKITVNQVEHTLE